MGKDEDDSEREINKMSRSFGNYVCRVQFGVFTRRVCTKPKGHKGGHSGPKLK
jgi:hypothetical protein